MQVNSTLFSTFIALIFKGLDAQRILQLGIGFADAIADGFALIVEGEHEVLELGEFGSVSKEAAEV